MPDAPRPERGAPGILLRVSRVPRTPTARPVVVAPSSQGASAPPAPLVWRTDVGDIAWQVLLRDGHLVPLWDDAALPAGVPATPRLRAAALSPLVPARCAVARESAVWVHLGGPPPARVRVVAAGRERVPEPAPGRSSCSADLTERDVVLIGDVQVTTVRRTALDVLTQDPPDRALPLLVRLRGAGLDLDRLATDLATATGRRGVREAPDVLRRLRTAGRETLPPPTPR